LRGDRLIRFSIFASVSPNTTSPLSHVKPMAIPFAGRPARRSMRGLVFSVFIAGCYFILPWSSSPCRTSLVIDARIKFLNHYIQHLDLSSQCVDLLWARRVVKARLKFLLLPSRSLAELAAVHHPSMPLRITARA